MTGDDLQRLLRDVRRLVTHLHIATTILLVTAGAWLGIAAVAASC